MEIEEIITALRAENPIAALNGLLDNKEKVSFDTIASAFNDILSRDNCPQDSLNHFDISGQEFREVVPIRDFLMTRTALENRDRTPEYQILDALSTGMFIGLQIAENRVRARADNSHG